MAMHHRLSAWIFHRFEALLFSYPEAEPMPPPKGFLAFIWACSQGARGYLVLLAVLAGVLAAFEALMFAVLGRMVDWLAGEQLPRIC